MNDSSPQLPPDRQPAHERPAQPASAPQRAADAYAHLTGAVYQHLPVLVVHLTLDGAVMNLNPEAERVLGYREAELQGRNFWAVLFPGRLFAQVPRFMSLIEPVHHFTRDVPMTLRTRDGKDRVIAWTRHLLPATDNPVGPGLGMKSMLCMGVDLTDRLNAADLLGPARPGEQPQSPGPNVVPESALTIMGVSSEGTVDGEIVTPIAISPPATGSPAVAIAQVHDFLMEVQKRVEALQDAYARGELEQLATIASTLRQGAYACGLLDFSARAERLHVAASGRALGDVTTLVKEISNMVRHGHGPGGATP